MNISSLFILPFHNSSCSFIPMKKKNTKESLQWRILRNPSIHERDTRIQHNGKKNDVHFPSWNPFQNVVLYFMNSYKGKSSQIIWWGIHSIYIYISNICKQHFRNGCLTLHIFRIGGEEYDGFDTKSKHRTL